LMRYRREIWVGGGFGRTLTWLSWLWWHGPKFKGTVLSDRSKLWAKPRNLWFVCGANGSVFQRNML
jgi:hypothetical protein